MLKTTIHTTLIRIKIPICRFQVGNLFYGNSTKVNTIEDVVGPVHQQFRPNGRFQLYHN